VWKLLFPFAGLNVFMWHATIGNAGAAMTDKPNDNAASSPGKLIDPATRPLLKDNFDIYETFRSYIRHEDGLINNRITWMLTIHGFLYASYGFTIQKKLEILDKINSFIIEAKIPFSDYLAESDFWFALLEIEVFLILIAVVGMFISRYASRSVDAARHAVSSTRSIFEIQYPPFPVSRETKTKITDEEMQAIIARGDERTLVERVVNIGTADKQVWAPTIAGGGNKALIRKGYLASISIPRVLFVSWIIAIFFSVIYLLLNFSILKLAFKKLILLISFCVT
jgi:hypothetical protein